ncbi:MAG: acyl-CoA hydrolase [Polyangiales bacterium]|jgi:acyl-CoA hydrolase
MQERAASQSHTTVTELMIPSYANFGGKVHGGILLGLMDKVAYVCASKHAGGYCVTVAVDGVAFRAPVEVGDLVSMHAAVNYVGRSSLLVGIRVEAENVRTHEIRHTNTSYFWMVAKDDDGKPRRVPPLLLETRDDVRRFLEGIQRKEMGKRYAAELDNAQSDLAIERELPSLVSERCSIQPGAISE